MLSEIVSLVIGIIVGQETNVPRMRPIVINLYQKCIDVMTTPEKSLEKNSIAKLFDNLINNKKNE